MFQGIPLSESDEHTFQPKASTWSDPSKAGGYGWGQLSHMFAGVYKVTKLNPKKVFCLSVPLLLVLIIQMLFLFNLRKVQLVHSQDVLMYQKDMEEVIILESMG